jgi:hypothetical protein
VLVPKSDSIKEAHPDIEQQIKNENRILHCCFDIPFILVLRSSGKSISEVIEQGAPRFLHYSSKKRFAI